MTGARRRIVPESATAPSVSALAARAILRAFSRRPNQPKVPALSGEITARSRVIRASGTHEFSGKERAWAWLGLELARLDPVLDELLAERVAVDTEDLRGPNLSPPGLPEHRAEQRLLDQADHQVVEIGAGVLAETAHALRELALDDLLERRVDGHRGRRRDRADRQVLGQDDAAGGHHHRALDHVLQLAHVARPIVADQPIE